LEGRFGFDKDEGNVWVETNFAGDRGGHQEPECEESHFGLV
jgi:hypothetical protein